MKKLALLWISLLLKDIQQYTSNGLHQGKQNENNQYEKIPPCLELKHRLQKRETNEQLINYGRGYFQYDTQTAYGNSVQYSQNPYLNLIQQENGYAEELYGQIAQNIIQDPYDNIIEDPYLLKGQNVIEDPYGQLTHNLIEDPYAQYHKDADSDLCRYLHHIWEHEQYLQYKIEHQKARDRQSKDVSNEIKSIDAPNTYEIYPKYKEETEHKAGDDPHQMYTHQQKLDLGYQHQQENSVHNFQHQEPHYHNYHQKVKSGEENPHGLTYGIFDNVNKNREGMNYNIEHPVLDDQGGDKVIDLEVQPMNSHNTPKIVQHDDHSLEKEDSEPNNSNQNENNGQTTSRDTDKDQDNELPSTESNSDESTVVNDEGDADNADGKNVELENETEGSKSMESYDGEEEEEEDIVKYYKYK